MKLKSLTAGSRVQLAELSQKEHKTQPPPRYSEVSLVKKLSDLGIGRPSTFASIVSVIQDRGYVRKVSGQQLAPTFLGFAVIQLLTNHFPQYTAFEYTEKMEQELERIEDGTQTRPKFLASFWNGSSGFEAFVKGLSTNVDWDEVKKLTTIELGNGYSVTYNRHGAFLQDDNGKPNEKGFLPSAKIDEESLVEEYLDPEVCKKLIEKSAASVGNTELGELSSGPYTGWTVHARDGKFGPFIQAISPVKSKKPVNQKLPEDMSLETVKLEDIEGLFSEIKLPRTLSDNFFVGIGKKGQYVGFKKTAKTRRATFKSLPEEFDPRTVKLEDVKAFWESKD